MYNRLAISSLLILLGGVFLGQAALAKRVQSWGPERFVGTWAGTWEGAGSTGKIEMTLAKDEAGKLSGQTSTTTTATIRPSSSRSPSQQDDGEV